MGCHSLLQGSSPGMEPGPPALQADSLPVSYQGCPEISEQRFAISKIYAKGSFLDMVGQRSWPASGKATGAQPAWVSCQRRGPYASLFHFWIIPWAAQSLSLCCHPTDPRNSEIVPEVVYQLLLDGRFGSLLMFSVLAALQVSCCVAVGDPWTLVRPPGCTEAEQHGGLGSPY